MQISLMLLSTKGEQIVSPGQLQPAPTESLYEGMTEDSGKEANQGKCGKLRNQHNDVSKYEMEGRNIKMQYILENESSEDYRLILRKAGYEGAVYRNEYEEKQIYPVVILVLYWGDKKWKPHADLHKFFKKKLGSPALEEYVDNIKLHVFSMAHLPQKVRQRFRSDIRIVVDYLAEGENFKPTNQTIEHIRPVMRLLNAMTGEIKMLDLMADMLCQQEKGEEVDMGEYYLSKRIREGREQGIQEGCEQGLFDGAKAFVMASISRGSAVDYIYDMVQQCFKFSREEAEKLYEECKG